MQAASRKLAALHREIGACRKCAEAGYVVESAPHLVVSGPVDARLMVIGQAPPSERSSHGRPFSGPAGQRLFKWLAEAGWEEEDFRARCYITAIIKCYPGKAPKGDRRPTAAEQKLCRPFLDRELALVRPAVIVLVGGLAIDTFLGDNRLEDIVGRVVVRDDVRYVPLPHPSGASLWLNAPQNQARVRRSLGALEQLKHTLQLTCDSTIGGYCEHPGYQRKNPGHQDRCRRRQLVGMDCDRRADHGRSWRTR